MELGDFVNEATSVEAVASEWKSGRGRNGSRREENRITGLGAWQIYRFPWTVRALGVGGTVTLVPDSISSFFQISSL